MPTPRKPSRLRIVAGTVGATKASRAQRDGRVPKGRGELGPPPPRLNAEQAQLWHDVERAAPAGLLCAVDRSCVESWCVLEHARQRALAEWNRTENQIIGPGERGAINTAPALRELRRLTAMANSFAKDLGFNPRARQSLELVPPASGEPDALARFLR
jgi:phage terminase small subunit